MIIIDYRNICKIASYSILSGSIACSWPTETEEIASRIVKRIYCLLLDYSKPNDRIIFANDKPPYWRARYVNQWYSDRGLEPIGYKANRLSAPWPFAASQEQINQIYALLLQQLAGAFGATVIEDEGLEADDIFGLITANVKTETITAISMDSDWRQLAGPSVTVVDPATGEQYMEPLDIRPKLVAGDRGDNVMGCPKAKKDGSAGTTSWGISGAEKLVAKHPEDWDAKLDAAILEKNYNLIKLPCPLWDSAAAYSNLMDMAQTHGVGDTNGILDQYGITEPVRKQLSDKAERQKWIEALRARLQTANIPKPEVPAP
jgi:hypothetical protein